MLPRLKCPVIALEEHYWDKELAAQFVGGEGVRDPEMLKRLYDLGEVRLKEMDEAGIDVQILSHGAPSAQKLSGADAADLTRRVNDRLHAVVTANPKRFAAFAALPTSDPKAAADELERTTKLGFKGAMIHGLANGTFLDDKRFWPIYERAQALDIPIYLHPSVPLPAVMDAYYKDYAKDFPMVVRAAWGYTVETATQAIRLVLSGVFDAYPRLKIILGHLGETLPFLVWRIDQALARPGAKTLSFRDAFCGHFYHDQRQLLQSGAVVLRDGARHRPYPVRGRLAVCRQQAGRAMDGNRAAVRRGQGQDSERQRPAPAPAVGGPASAGSGTIAAQGGALYGDGSRGCRRYADIRRARSSTVRADRS